MNNRTQYFLQNVIKTPILLPSASCLPKIFLAPSLPHRTLMYTLFKEKTVLIGQGELCLMIKSPVLPLAYTLKKISALYIGFQA